MVFDKRFCYRFRSVGVVSEKSRFREPAGNLGLGWVIGPAAKWALLPHLEFISSLEPKFGISLSPRDMTPITQFRATMAKIE